MADIVKCNELDDPNRCQAVNSQGQCRNKAVCTDDGIYGEYCLAHGGNKFLQKHQQAGIRNYQLDKFKARLSRHATSPALKNLRDEIAILRMMMEERLNRCDTPMDLILYSGPISDLVMKIEKIVASCHKLEGSMGQLLDKSALLQFASEVIDIIGTEVNETITDKELGEVLIGKVGNKIMKSVGRLGGDDEGI
jgi:hypothetical protein